MEVEYELTRDDIYAFQWRANYTSPSARRARLKAYVYVFLALLALWLLPAIISGDGFDISIMSLMLFAVPFLIMVFFGWIFLKWQMRRAILKLVQEEKPDQGQLGSHKISLTETQLVETTHVGQSLTKWAGVDRVEQNDDYIFIYTTPHAAYVVPKRSFDSKNQAESFYQLARVSKEAGRLTAKF
jgi:hypothetical protein